MSTFTMFGAKITVSGDKEGCKAYLGEVNRILFQLRVLSRSVPFYSVGPRKFDDGTVMIAFTADGREYVTIYKPEGKPPEKEEKGALPFIAYAVDDPDETDPETGFPKVAYVVCDENLAPLFFVKDEYQLYDIYDPDDLSQSVEYANTETEGGSVSETEVPNVCSSAPTGYESFSYWEGTLTTSTNNSIAFASPLGESISVSGSASGSTTYGGDTVGCYSFGGSLIGNPLRARGTASVNGSGSGDVPCMADGGTLRPAPDGEPTPWPFEYADFEGPKTKAYLVSYYRAVTESSRADAYDKFTPYIEIGGENTDPQDGNGGWCILASEEESSEDSATQNLYYHGVVRHRTIDGSVISFDGIKALDGVDYESTRALEPCELKTSKDYAWGYEESSSHFTDNSTGDYFNWMVYCDIYDARKVWEQPKVVKRQGREIFLYTIEPASEGPS